MAERFPGGRLVFDAAGQTAVKLMLKTWVRQAGIWDGGIPVQDGEGIARLVRPHYRIQPGLCWAIRIYGAGNQAIFNRLLARTPTGR